jgi:hypothetical protein
VAIQRVTKDIRWQLVVLALSSVPLLLYALIQDWEVGQYYAYGWGAGHGDTLAHWLALMCVLVIVAIPLRMLLDREREVPRHLALYVAVMSSTGCIATLVAVKRIADNPGVDGVYWSAVGGEGDPYTHVTGAAIVCVMGFVVALAASLLLWRTTRPDQMPA